MSVIKPEMLEKFINEGHFKVNVSGPLHSPVKYVKIKRDDKLQLILTTISDASSASGSIIHPPGTVRINDDSIELTNVSTSKLKMNGVQPFGYTDSTDENGNTICTELSSVNSIEAIIKDVTTGKYLIEWLENVDDGFFIWPDSVETKIENHTLVSVGEEPNKVEIREKSSSKGFGRKCVYQLIGGHQLYLVSTGDDAKSIGVTSGYIIYLGVPSSDERKKIRNCLSFVLGRPLIKTAYSIFDSKWQLVSFKLISAYSIGGAAFSVHSLPPSPLGKKYQGEVDGSMMSTLVNAIYKNYDLYKFGHLSWAYWHAICAPVHIAAVHFGACIESLQNSYIENNGKVFNSALIEKSKWTVLRKEALNALKNLKLDESQKKVLENKINSLNQTPQSIMTERFLNNLGIQFSEIEKSAWQQRNNAAHGNEIEEGGEIKLIREIKILKIIFHRVLLKIMGGTEYYVDYYSIGFPIKFLSESIDAND